MVHMLVTAWYLPNKGQDLVKVYMSKDKYYFISGVSICMR